MLHSLLAGVLTISIVAALGSGPAHAQGNLLDKLKGMGVQTPGGGTQVPGTGSRSALGEADIAKGLREALKVGSERVVGALGKVDGFNNVADVHIPLPGTLRTVQQALGKVGQSALVDDLETRLNRAAEAAVPRAKSLFWKAIETMTLDDARRILDGPKDAATQYFRGKMASPLASDMKPIVDQELAKAGAVKSYDQMMGQYKSIPFVPDAKADLTQHVLEKAIDGVFLYLGREEAAIRDDPAKRTTALLQKVFAK
ncbi:MAG: DUF4197 domain-containing protein [Alphaproteobacteria bacterium]